MAQPDLAASVGTASVEAGNLLPGNDAVKRVAVIAISAVALGIIVQLLILAAKLLAGARFPGVALLADIAQGVTWALLVCTGVAIGTAILRVRATLSGLIAMVFAPIAVAAAKASQRLVGGLLEVADQQAVLGLGSVSMMRALEYGTLGFLLGTLAQRGERRLSRYAGAGATVGLVLGGAVVALTAYVAIRSGPGLSSPALAGAIVNEMFFPIGCAIVVYSGLLVGNAMGRMELALKSV